MHVVRLEQTEGPDDRGNELDIYWLDVVLDDEKRLVERSFLGRRAGDLGPSRVARGTIVAPWWHVRLDVGDGDTALLHWHGLLAELGEDGVWHSLYPSLLKAHVMGAPMVVRNYAFNMRTGAMRVRRPSVEGRGIPTAADKAKLLAVVKQFFPFRGPEARANPARRLTATLNIDRSTSADLATFSVGVGTDDTRFAAVLVDKISGLVTFELNQRTGTGPLQQAAKYRARGDLRSVRGGGYRSLERVGGVAWHTDAATVAALEEHGSLADQLLLWLGEYPSGSYSVPWELAA